MIIWMLAFLFFILLLASGEIAANVYLTKLVHSSIDVEEEIVNSAATEN